MKSPVYLGMNTLAYDPLICINCGMCSIVCPHAVFIEGETHAQMVGKANCIECGACALNCPTGAISVDSGVGCATLWITSAIQKYKGITHKNSTDCC